MDKNAAYRKGFYEILAKAGISKEAFHKIAMPFNPALVKPITSAIGSVLKNPDTGLYANMLMSSGGHLLNFKQGGINYLRTVLGNLGHSPEEIEQIVAAHAKRLGTPAAAKGVGTYLNPNVALGMRGTSYQKPPLTGISPSYTEGLGTSIVPRDQRIIGTSYTKPAYDQGFIDKCAEYGIDLNTLINMIKR